MMEVMLWMWMWMQGIIKAFLKALGVMLVAEVVFPEPSRWSSMLKE